MSAARNASNCLDCETAAEMMIIEPNDVEGREDEVIMTVYLGIRGQTRMLFLYLCPRATPGMGKAALIS